MIRYDNATNREMDYNLTNIHFFTRVFLTRTYQKHTARKLPAITTLPSFNLFVDEKDIELLESDLPASARLQFIQSHIKIDKPEFLGEAQFRYRGGLPMHWLYDKNHIE